MLEIDLLAMTCQVYFVFVPSPTVVVL